MKTIGLIIKPNISEVSALIVQLTNWATNHNISIISNYRNNILHHIQIVSDDELRDRADLIVVLGGDGTIITTARILGKRNIPVIGVNFGFLGYLAEYTQEDIFTALESVINGNYKVGSRIKLETTVIRNNEQIASADVINDVVVNKSLLARIIGIQCWINKQFVSTFRADGLIVATPTGSTAYSLSAGGPIIHPNMHAMVITPICPHTLTNRPLVIPDEAEIELCLVATDSQNKDVTLTLDGQIGIPLHSNDRIVIHKSESVLNLVESPSRNYFQILRDKLSWGN